MTTETTTDRTRIATAYKQLKHAALLTEQACESLSPVEGLAERWERIRELVFALKEERDRLEEYTECPIA